MAQLGADSRPYFVSFISGHSDAISFYAGIHTGIHRTGQAVKPQRESGFVPVSFVTNLHL